MKKFESTQAYDTLCSGIGQLVQEYMSSSGIKDGTLEHEVIDHLTKISATFCATIHKKVESLK